MNEFQKKGCESITRFLRKFPELKIGDFEEIQGRKENYLNANFLDDKKRPARVYVYLDEIGFEIDGVFIILEKPDYSSPDELIEASLYKLGIALGVS